jgi:propanediol dehydratase small subunit
MTLKEEIKNNSGIDDLIFESGEDDMGDQDLRKTASSLLHQAYTHKDVKKAKLALSMIKNDKIKKMVEKAIEDCDWNKMKKAMIDL